MLEQEADEDVVEALLGEGKIVDVRDLEADVGVAGGLGPRPRPLEMLGGDVDRDDLGLGARGGEVHRLRARAAAALQYTRAGRVVRAGARVLGKRVGLVGEARSLAQGI